MMVTAVSSARTPLSAAIIAEVNMLSAIKCCGSSKWGGVIFYKIKPLQHLYHKLVIVGRNGFVYLPPAYFGDFSFSSFH